MCNIRRPIGNSTSFYGNVHLLILFIFTPIYYFLVRFTISIITPYIAYFPIIIIVLIRFLRTIGKPAGWLYTGIQGFASFKKCQ